MFDYNNYSEKKDLDLNDKSLAILVFSAKLFDEAFEKTNDELKLNKINWQDFPMLYSREDSFSFRMSSVNKGIKEKINLPPLIKKFMKSDFPQYLFKKTVAGRYLFFKQFNSNIKLCIGFERIYHLGLGKAFTLCLGIEHVDKTLLGHMWLENFFRLFGESVNWAPCYTYSVKSDLDQIFDSIKSLLEKTLPIFEKYLEHSFNKYPEKVNINILDEYEVNTEYRDLQIWKR